jgi:tRNA(Ile)-lysidine synthase
MDPPNELPLTDAFASALHRLGPFESGPCLAVAVSGGADSMALTILSHEWAARRAGSVLALTVDHGLRPESSAEADLTLRRLADFGILGRKLIVTALVHGPALAERARAARYRLLLDACRAEGIVHLLLGHHRSDQAETVMMRALNGSATRGLAGMAALSETHSVRLLRPLLAIAPECLRVFLRARGLAWVEDPSNRDRAALRARLRQSLADPGGKGEGTRALAAATRVAGALRARRDREIAHILAERATFRPEGYAVLTPGPIDPEALAALLRAIAGTEFSPPPAQVAALARDPGPVTLAGVRVAPAGRLGRGWLLAREPRAMAAPVAAMPNATWDGRFRLIGHPPDEASRGVELGSLGVDSARFRDRTGPPALVLRTLPALRQNGVLIAVPHANFGDPRWRVIFSPRNAATSAPFMSS